MNRTERRLFLPHRTGSAPVALPVVALTAAALLLVPAAAANAQVNLGSMTLTGQTYSFSQMFDPPGTGSTLDPNGQWLPTYGDGGNGRNGNNGTLPWTSNVTLKGWYGDAVNNEITVTDGSSNNRGLANLGLIGSTDRALGLISQGNEVDVRMALRLVNDTNKVVTSFTVGFRGEQWRTSGNGISKLVFDYGLFAAGQGSYAATTYASGAQTGGLTFTSPVGTGTPRELNGNGTTTAGNTTVNNFQPLTGTINNVEWKPGQELWLRWTNNQTGGADNGLAIDDLSLSFYSVAIPEPGTLALLPVGALALVGAGAARRRRPSG
jgi:hypothetical protein